MLTLLAEYSAKVREAAVADGALVGRDAGAAVLARVLVGAGRHCARPHPLKRAEESVLRLDANMSPLRNMEVHEQGKSIERERERGREREREREREDPCCSAIILTIGFILHCLCR